MNKITKGAIASAAGVALLLGGAGTFALWNTSSTVAGGTLSTGNLALSPGTGTWTDTSPTSAGTTTYTTSGTTGIGTASIVPGDQYTLTQPVSITATGKNMKGSFTFDASKIILGTGLTLGTNFTETMTASVATSPAQPGAATIAQDLNNPNTYIVTPGTASTPTVVNVTFVFTFVNQATGQGTTGTNSSVNLTNFAYTLTQVRP
jgi:alternate signal-mediated exported protein